MKQFLSKITSRKFLLAVSAFTFAVAHGNVLGAVSVALGYLGVEGAVDHAIATYQSNGNGQ